MDHLTTDQARKIHDALGPPHGYLVRLVERMDRTNLCLGDPKLYALARRAEDAMRSLTVELHYQSCGHGVGRPPRGGTREGTGRHEPAGPSVSVGGGPA